MERCSPSVQSALEWLQRESDADTATMWRFVDDHHEFVIVAVAGEAIVRATSRLPVSSSTNALVPYQGRSFGCGDLPGLAEYRRPLDRIALAAGLRSGCTVPLSLGARVVGAVSLGSRQANWAWREAQDLIAACAPKLVAGLEVGADDHDSSRVLVCHDDALVGEGLVRLSETVLGIAPQVSERSIEAVGSRVETDTDMVITGVFTRGLRIDQQVDVLVSMGVTARVVAIASQEVDDIVAAAARANVAGYVMAASPRDVIADVLRAVARGRRVVPFAGAAQPSAPLSVRERQVLLLLSRGLSAKEVAGTLLISVPTVKWHTRQLFEKLGAHSATSALHVAQSSGLLPSLIAAEAADPLLLGTGHGRRAQLSAPAA